jgi:hypothetical protein
MKKGDRVRYKEPLDESEKKDLFILPEEPDGGRVLAEGICDLPIRPTKVLRIDEIELDK